VPRNVVTVVRRRSILPRRAGRTERQDHALAQLEERYRVVPRDGEGVEIHFPNALGKRAAKEQVVAELERIEPAWSRLFVVYPRESALRGHDRQAST